MVFNIRNNVELLQLPVSTLALTLDTSTLGNSFEKSLFGAGGVLDLVIMPIFEILLIGANMPI